MNQKKEILFGIVLPIILFGPLAVFAADNPPCTSRDCIMEAEAIDGNTISITITGYDDNGVSALMFYDDEWRVRPCAGTPDVCEGVWQSSKAEGTYAYYGKVYDNADPSQSSDTVPDSIHATFPLEPDFDVTNLFMTAPVGQMPVTGVEIKNIGNIPSNPGWELALFVDGGSAPAAIKNIDQSIDVGEELKVYFTYSEWPFDSGQSYALEVCADYGGAVDELDEENNCMSRNVYAPYPRVAELHVTSLYFDAYRGIVQANLHNSGMPARPAGTAVLLVDGEIVASLNTSMGAGEYWFASFYDWHPQEGNVYSNIEVCVDYYDDVLEVHEDNNCRTDEDLVIDLSDIECLPWEDGRRDCPCSCTYHKCEEESCVPKQIHFTGFQQCLSSYVWGSCHCSCPETSDCSNDSDCMGEIPLPKWEEISPF